MKLYTRQGDGGQTTLFGGRRVAKTDPRMIACGEVDELNSHLGSALALCRHADMTELLAGLQHQLFDLGADLATPEDAPNAAKVRRITEAQVTALEREIDRACAGIPPLTQFILPGGSPLGAALHVARAVCRRAERSVASLCAGDASVHTVTLIWINRLSDLLFALAREANLLDGAPETFWDHTRWTLRPSALPAEGDVPRD